MNQNSNHGSQHEWLGQVMKAEQTILDGQMLPMEQLLAIPTEIRMKSPLLLRAECENGLLNGQLMETKQRLEAALRGFAAQADESAMLTMMAMLGLMYIQVGDRHEAKPFMALLEQEWMRNPEHCSGFVPWALARSAASLTGAAEARFADARELLAAAAERFREEGRPLWTGFVLLDGLIFDPREPSHADWPLWINWLRRHAPEHSLSAAVLRVLNGSEPDAGMCALLPVRYAYLSRAVLLQEAAEALPEELADDIECGIYAAGAAVRRQAAEGRIQEAAETLRLLKRRRLLVSTPAVERLVAALQDETEAAQRAAARTETRSAAKTASKTATKTATQKATETAARSVTKKATKNTTNRIAHAAPLPSYLMDMGTGSASAYDESNGVPPRLPDAGNPRWKVKLFGGVGFSLENGRQADPVWKRRKAGELFVYLLLQQGYKANREQVIERVFGEGDSAKRSNQLYVTLHDLRSALKEIGLHEDAVYAKRGVIGISEQIVESVDAEAFMTQARVGDQLWMDDREAAVRLYDKAILLYGVLAPELPNAEWLERAREQLLDRQTTLLKRLVTFYGDQNDEARQEQRLSDWIALRPDQEEAYEGMIRLCLRGNRRVEAIGWYRRLERICKEELGIEPLAEVRKLLWI